MKTKLTLTNWLIIICVAIAIFNPIFWLIAIFILPMLANVKEKSDGTSNNNGDSSIL